MTSALIMICGVLILAKWSAQMALEWVNQQHVQAHANAVPAAFTDTVTPETYAKSAAYTLAKSRFEMIHLTWSAAILAVDSFQRRAAVVLPRFSTRRRLIGLGGSGFSAGGGSVVVGHGFAV